ncbi:hypothetical protein Tco_0749640 [Tanacetum coccineum]|uniref:Integrase, catalytic region, zinc finger, CCHC-type, peptidase aspartic, catalytic n=1 Tax=Tanacetum coccineum TaxID=301880 RepID=A0ABQ4YZ24_9ASTR
MDDMIKEKLALKEQVDPLEQNLSKQIKENECLLQTFIVFKNESKEKENKHKENEIDLEKKIKKLDNIIFKVGQSAQTVHMLTKPQVFYDNIHKQALGYQNSFYLKKAQRIKPTLYDGIIIYAKHVVMPVIDDEETLIFEEESRSKMSEKEKDPDAIKQNISHKPIDYEKLNRLSEDFGKRFTPQQELSVEQAFWLRISNPTSKPFDASLVKIEAPKELPKSDSLIDKLNLKCAENEDLKAQIQDKIFVITSLKNDLRKLKGKEIVDIAAQTPSAYTIVPGMFKLDLEPLAPRLLQNREAHIDYLKYTQEQADILRGIVEQAKAKQPLDNALDFACKHTQRIQELLVYVRDTCHNAIKLNTKKVAVTPKNKVKKVRFAEPLTSSSNIKQVESSTTSDSNTPVLSPTGLKCSTSNYGSKPTSNKKNDRISRTPSRNMKNKVEAQPRKVNKNNHVVEPIRDVDVKHSLLNANSEPICATYNKSRTFTIVGNSCPLTRITSANVVPPKKTTSHSVETQKPELKVYSRKPKNVKNLGSSKKAKIIESKNTNHSEPNHTWGSNATDILSSFSLVRTGCPDCTLVFGLRMFEREHITGNRSQLMNFVSKFLGTVRFGNDQIARIRGSGLGLHYMTPVTSNTRLNSNPVSQQPSLPLIGDDWDRLFQPMFDEYFNPPTIAVSPVQEAVAPRAEVLADSPVSTSIN